ncbi:hypothetical protein ACLEEA_15325, partial [Lonsdalea quercina]
YSALRPHDYHQTNRKTDTGKTLKRWPVLVDHFTPDAIHEEGDSAWVWYRTSPDAEVSKHIIVRGKTVTQGIEIHGVEGGYVMVSGQ